MALRPDLTIGLPLSGTPTLGPQTSRSYEHRCVMCYFKDRAYGEAVK